MKKGSKHTEDTKRKIRLANLRNGNTPPSRLGSILTNEHKNKIRLSMKENGHIPPSAAGLKRSDEFKEKCSENNARFWTGKKKEEAANWRGGIPKRKWCLSTHIAQNLRSRLYQAIKKDIKTGSAVRDLGCTIPELKFYLEGQFQDGMTWANWSKTGWHIDHKIPLDFFDLTDREQFLQAVHYTNLQPMWAKENIKKGNKIIV